MDTYITYAVVFVIVVLAVRVVCHLLQFSELKKCHEEAVDLLKEEAAKSSENIESIAQEVEKVKGMVEDVLDDTKYRESITIIEKAWKEYLEGLNELDKKIDEVLESIKFSKTLNDLKFMHKDKEESC